MCQVKLIIRQIVAELIPPVVVLFFLNKKKNQIISSSHVYNSDSGVFGVRVDIEVYERLVVISE